MMSFNIIVKNYQHFNSSMGKFITSKRHYENEMSKGGYIPYEKACEITETVKNKREREQKFELSPKARSIIESARNSSDKKGNVRLGGRMIDAMQSLGVNFYNDNVPKHYRIDKGGFDNAS